MASKGGPPGHKAPTSNVSYRGVPSEAANIELIDRTLSLRRTFKVSWWERRSRTEKKLIIALPILILIIVIVIVIFTSVLASRSSVQSLGNSSALHADVTSARVTTCVTWDCVQTAASIMESINRSIDPCEDFFEYACGSRPHLPFGYRRTTHFSRIHDEQELLLKGLLEKPVSDDEIEAIRKVKELYKICLREPVDLTEKKLWLTLFLQTGGNSPVETDKWNETVFDLTQFIGRLRLHLGINSLFLFYVEADAKNSDRNVIYFDQPRNIPNLDPNTTTNNKLGYDALMSALYPSTITTTNSSTSSSSSTTNTTTSSSFSLADGFKEVVDFGNELKKILVPQTERRYHQLLYNRMTVADMYNNLTKEIDWLEYLRIIFSAVNITIEPDEPVVVLAPEFFVKLGQLLNRTSSRVVVNYLFWNTNLEPFEDFYGHREDFHQNHDRVDAALSVTYQWYVCTALVKRHLGMAVSRMYLDSYFKKESKGTVEQIVGEIKAAFSELVDEANWMDDDSKKLVQEKINAMNEKIAFPDDIFNDTKLNEMYRDIIIEPRNFTETVSGVVHVTAKQSIDQLRQPIDRTSWVALPILVNAYYLSVRNEIIVPASVIQAPFYRDINFPSALNLGGIGFVIGHEITHGFGDKGRQYDKGGNLTVWWPQQMTANFEEQVSCFVQQYNNFTVSQSKTQIDGLQTLGENIADNGGIRQSFRAYRRWVKRQGREEELLPGLNLSGNQLFFLQFAQVMCSRVEFEDYGHPSKPNNHCPSEIRVLGTLSNSYDFAEAYGCKVGSRMNPVRKCTVW